MGDERFRVLLVGAGRMGRVHLSAIEGSASVAAVGVVEPFDDAREQLAGSGLALHADLDAALAAGGFDAALIAAPSPLHPALVVAADGRRGADAVREAARAAQCRHRGGGPRRCRRRGAVADRLLAALRPRAAGIAGRDRVGHGYPC